MLRFVYNLCFEHLANEGAECASGALIGWRAHWGLPPSSIFAAGHFPSESDQPAARKIPDVFSVNVKLHPLLGEILYESKNVGWPVRNMEDLSADDQELANNVKLMLQSKFEKKMEKKTENNSILKSSSSKKIQIEDSDADHDDHNAFDMDDFPTSGLKEIIIECWDFSFF